MTGPGIEISGAYTTSLTRSIQRPHGARSPTSPSARRRSSVRSSCSESAGRWRWRPRVFSTRGSFKLRGALNKISALGQRASGGLVTASAGNHGQAVAYAARVRGVG
ncbi:MAG: hypothetical protein DLM63_00170 [Solirubrobacterales bacterium]|nr:MAG: hypothetical protein DLM63_00170 [Solirubrobacterales bacterium]